MNAEDCTEIGTVRLSLNHVKHTMSMPPIACVFRAFGRPLVVPFHKGIDGNLGCFEHDQIEGTASELSMSSEGTGGLVSSGSGM